MSAGGILLTFLVVCVGVSLIIALVCHFWPRFGSVEAAVEHADHLLDKIESAVSGH